ncbi:hypothetical protein TCAL_03378 [Tigriopus californicus]|uniref:Uncharacterized protein n=1 Tax=Tigriopus californicus TaxID=6832 RepID=A0A553P1N4_TIGCA|nr:hypothetical protein TCAL_03378 [Tigriopus californicus]|eukprot:TCALIF_03378-PA protein Name:"Protein of unknown function" AED:0.64 eAED:0.64 QI:0/-1/0/1/-1/1/1/0/124
MFLAGYTFHILDNGFVLHQGYKETVSMFPEWKLEQYKVNNGRFKDFLREITAKYQQDPCQMLDLANEGSPNFPDHFECSVSLGSSQSLSEDSIDILSPSETDQQLSMLTPTLVLQNLVKAITGS